MQSPSVCVLYSWLPIGATLNYLPLGQSSYPSTIRYIDNSYIYVGSKMGHSYIYRIDQQQGCLHVFLFSSIFILVDDSTVQELRTSDIYLSAYHHRPIL